MEEIIAALADPAIAIVRLLWHKAHGDDTKPDEAELRRIALAAVNAQIQRAELELQRLAAAAGVPIAADVLARTMVDLLAAVQAASAKPSLTDQLLEGVQVEEMPAGSKLDAAGDWTAPEEVPLSPVLDSDDLETKP